MASVYCNENNGVLNVYNITCLYHLYSSYSIFKFNLRCMHMQQKYNIMEGKKNILLMTITLERKLLFIEGARIQ